MRYPGSGPWSHLPPWERPGWKYGRGWCWRAFPWGYPSYGLRKEDKIKMLEDEARYLEERLEEIRKRLDELRKP